MEEKIMRTVFNDYDLYNQKDKEEFLSRYKNDVTFRGARRMLRHAKQMEEKYNKDLGQFTLEQIEYFILKILKPSTKMSAKTTGCLVSLYLRFAIDKGMRGDNPLGENIEAYEKYAYENETDLISFHQLDDITMTELVNANDALIVRLIFEGALGFELSEVANLKISDVDFDNNKVTLHDDSEKKEVKERVLEVSKGTMDLIKGSIKETIYIKKNNEMDDSNPRIKTQIELVDSEYVIRPTKNRNTDNEGKCSRATLYNRIRVIRESKALKDANMKWTTKQIQRSGMLFQALKILQTKDKLERSDYRKIAERFGISFFWGDRDIINLDTIIKVYGEDYKKINVDEF
jgi:integrase